MGWVGSPRAWVLKVTDKSFFEASPGVDHSRTPCDPYQAGIQRLKTPPLKNSHTLKLLNSSSATQAVLFWLFPAGAFDVSLSHTHTGCLIFSWEFITSPCTIGTPGGLLHALTVSACIILTPPWAAPLRPLASSDDERCPANFPPSPHQSKPLQLQTSPAPLPKESKSGCI